jgi:hypothetical protein
MHSTKNALYDTMAIQFFLQAFYPAVSAGRTGLPAYIRFPLCLNDHTPRPQPGAMAIQHFFLTNCPQEKNSVFAGSARIRTRSCLCTSTKNGSSRGNFILTYNLIHGMVFHMKTTLNISDAAMRQLKQEAARRGRTMSELVESALRALFHSKKTMQELPPLPYFRSGGTRVDVADRQSLYDVMAR